MRTLRFTLITVAASLLACDRGGASGDATIVRDSSGVTVIENDLTRAGRVCTIAPEPTVSIGIEEGDEHYMLARLRGAVRLSDGRIVLAERTTHNIRYYDANGRYLYSSGRQGEGPGEFRDPFGIHIRPNDTIYVGDYRPVQLLVFGPDGKWVRTVRPDPMEINNFATRNVLRDGRIIAGRSLGRIAATDQFTHDSILVMGYDAAGKLADTLGTFASMRYAQLFPGTNYSTVPYFEPSAQIRAAEDRVIVGHAASTELRVHRAEHGYPLERIIRWQTTDREITPADLAAERDRIQQSAARMPAEMRQQFLPTDMSDRRILNDRFPAFGQLQVGRDGRIWIREYPRPTDTTAHHWIAFERDGRLSCRLDTRRFAEYYEFGSDYLLVRDPDSLDIERVRQFPLRNP